MVPPATATITEEARAAAAAAGIALEVGTVVHQRRCREYDAVPGELIGMAPRGETYTVLGAETHTIDSVTYVACRVKSALVEDLEVFINIQSVHGLKCQSRPHFLQAIVRASSGRSSPHEG